MHKRPADPERDRAPASCTNERPIDMGGLSVVTRAPDRPTASRRFHLVTVLLSAWMVGGIFVDGWAHINLPGTEETFFTPWHAILYAGFVAAATWVAVPLLRHRDRPVAARVPVGYGLGVVGLVLFAAGGAGDGWWHTVFGIETGVDALLSPTHLLLLTGGLLLLTSPVRAADHTFAVTAPTLRQLLPAVAALALSAAVVGFFFAYAWGAIDLSPADPLPSAALDEHAAGHREAEQLVAFSILSRVLSTAVLVGPLVYLARRWRLPAGATTIVFATVSVPLFVLAAGSTAAPSSDASLVALLLAPLVAAVLGDVGLRSVRVGPDRPWTLYAFSAGVTLLLWAGHFLAMATSVGLAWPPELWGGAIGMSVLTAIGLAALAQPRA